MRLETVTTTDAATTDTVKPRSIYGQPQRDALSDAYADGHHRAEAGTTDRGWHVVSVTVAPADLVHYALPYAGDWLHIVTEDGDDWAYGPLTLDAADAILDLWRDEQD